MEPARIRRRLADARVGRLGTVTPDGRPHLVPCCFALGGPEGETIYTPVDAKPKSTMELQRILNIRKNPHVTLLVDHYAADWDALWWVRADGTARVLEVGEDERAQALDLLAARYRQYRYTPPPGPVIAIDITTWRAWP